MEFCPDCGSMLIPNKGKLKCKCGYESDLSNKDEYTVKDKIVSEDTVIVRDDSSNVMPTKKIKCYKCGGTEGIWWVVQTRSADEAPTYFTRCTKCGNTWRQSN